MTTMEFQRRAMGISRKQLAEQVECCVSHIRTLEKGYFRQPRKRKVVEKLEKVLGLPFDDLLEEVSPLPRTIQE